MLNYVMPWDSTKMNKKIILLVTAFILLPMVTATDSSFIFEQNEPAGISVPVHSNDLSSCDTCSCYLTVKAPNGSVILSEQPMAIDGGYAEHTLSGDYTDELGTHECRIKCSNGADYGFTTFSFEITSTGNKVSLSNIIMPIAFLVIAGILLVIGYGFSIDHWMLKTFFNFAAVGMGILSVNSSKIIASESSALGSMGTTGLTIMYVIFAIFMIYMFIYMFIEIIRVFKRKKELRWDYT